MNRQKMLKKLISRQTNVPFAEAIALAKAFGFSLARVQGSHHILKHQEIPELVNLQEVGGQAKPYQIRQLLELIERYDLPKEDEK